MLDGKSEKSEMPQTAIGQGKTLITPLLNCMIISAVANGGVMMSPYVLDHVESYDGNMVKKFTPTIYKEVMTEKEANTLEKMLVGVVEGGTGSALAGLKHTYAGKTGTAEHDEKGNAHAWFVGYSNVKKPDIAICVLVENGASGSGVAVPIAKQVFTTYYNKND